jgi:hypothetical protein
VTSERIKEYVKARNEALEGSLEDFVDFLNRLGQLPADPRVITVSYHQLRTACVSLPMKLRSKSKKWLLGRGMQSWDDGDVP